MPISMSMSSMALAAVTASLAMVGASSPHAVCLEHTDCAREAGEQCFFASNQDLRMKREKAHREPHGICVTRDQMSAFLQIQEGTSGTAQAKKSQQHEQEHGEKGAESGHFAIKVPEGNVASVVMGGEKDGYEIKVSPSGELEMGTRHASGEAPYLKFGNDGKASANVRKMKANSFDASGGFVVRGPGGEKVHQWSLVASDSWEMVGSDDKARGWQVETGDMADPTPQMCGGTTMLGGPSNGDGEGLHAGEISKTYTGLGKHTSVRISATFHFIDLWLGEFAYMKLSSGKAGSDGITLDEYVWTKSYHAADTAAGLVASTHPPSGLNVCGDPNIVEMEFSTVVDVAVPHKSDTLKVTFGTRLPATAKAIVGGASWGISRVGVHVKNVGTE